MPSVVPRPTVYPASFMIWASMREVVVLPLVPVMLAMGMVLGAPGGNSMSMIGPATSLGVPSLGADRKSTRLNSSHQIISYAVFCLKKKKEAYYENSTWNTQRSATFMRLRGASHKAASWHL